MNAHTAEIQAFNIDSSSWEGRKIILGISLANKIFNGDFFDQLHEAVITFRPLGFEILLFDRCESYNYEVFRCMPAELAMAKATARANELRSFISRRLKGTLAPTQIQLESELIEIRDEIDSLECNLTALYTHSSKFREDVDKQVGYNIARRISNLRAAGHLPPAKMLAKYVVRELAVFSAWLRWKEWDIEIYPGEELFVKRRLWQGLYGKICGAQPERLPRFQNLLDSREDSVKG